MKNASFESKMELGGCRVVPLLDLGGSPIEVRVVDGPVGEHGAPGAPQVVVGVDDARRDVQRVSRGDAEGCEQEGAVFNSNHWLTAG